MVHPQLARAGSCLVRSAFLRSFHLASWLTSFSPSRPSGLPFADLWRLVLPAKPALLFCSFCLTSRPVEEWPKSGHESKCSKGSLCTTTGYVLIHILIVSPSLFLSLSRPADCSFRLLPCVHIDMHIPPCHHLFFVLQGSVCPSSTFLELFRGRGLSSLGITPAPAKGLAHTGHTMSVFEGWST